MTAFSRKYYRSLEPLLKPEALSRPLNWPEIFGRDGPRELEIGFGNGEFMHRRSLAAPERDFVGLEIAWASAKRALRRLANPPRSNVRLILMKAEAAVERCFSAGDLDVIRSLFPVPWPDERQERKRLFQRDFLDLAADRLKPAGRFILVTDSPELAHWTMEQGQGSALELTLEERPAEMDTKYERKWQGGGQRTFFHLTGRRAPDARPRPERTLEIVDMQAYYRRHLDPDLFAPEGCSGDIVVKFKEFIYDRERDQGLLRTFVVEGPLIQDFFINIRRDGDRWKLSPAIASQLFPTQGVARALELAAREDS